MRGTYSLHPPSIMGYILGLKKRKFVASYGEKVDTV